MFCCQRPTQVFCSSASQRSPTLLIMVAWHKGMTVGS
ncbi:hypothetical protein OROHE_021039 [Orobanche hederae]